MTKPTLPDNVFIDVLQSLTTMLTAMKNVVESCKPSDHYDLSEDQQKRLQIVLNELP